MIPLTMRMRLTLWFSGLACMLLLIMCAALMFQARTSLFARTLSELAEELGEIEREIAQHETRREMLAGVAPRFSVHGVESQTGAIDYDFLVFEADGSQTFLSDRVDDAMLAALRELEDPAAGQLLWLQLPDGREFVASHKLTRTAYGELQLYAATSPARLWRDLGKLNLILLAVLPVSLFVSAFIGYWVAGLAIKPIRQLADEASELSINSLHKRVSVRRTHDEIGQLSQSLNDLISGLQSAVAEIRRFTADASHELRTPLAVIRIEAELALSRQRSVEDYRTALQLIVRETERLGVLAAHMLDLARSDGGVSIASNEIVELNRVLENEIRRHGNLTAQKSLTVQVSCSGKALVRGDLLRLQMVVGNLLSNAVKYSPAGGTIRLTCEERAGDAELMVQDFGPGIAAEHLPRLFDRFYRVDTSRNSATGGTGLGLAIVKAVVTGMNGSVAVDSEVGKGTAFRVRLPLFDAAATGRVTQKQGDSSDSA